VKDILTECGAMMFTVDVVLVEKAKKKQMKDFKSGKQYLKLNE